MVLGDVQARQGGRAANDLEDAGSAADLWDTRPAEEAAQKKKEAVRKQEEAAREERVASALAALEVKFGAGKIVRGSAVRKT